MKFMMPNTSVSPAAMRNSMTPNCRPFSSCSKRSAKFIKKGAVAPFWVIQLFNSPLHLAVLVVRVLVLFEHRLLDPHLDVAARHLLRPQQVEVLDRVMVDVVGVRPADRVVVRL